MVLCLIESINMLIPVSHIRISPRTLMCSGLNVGSVCWADGTKKERLLATDKEAGGELKGAGAWHIARLQLLVCCM